MPSPVSFASFNLENFQVAGLRARGRAPVSRAAYEGKMNWTRAVVQDLDADVIVFQELWSRSCLEDVFDHPTLADYTVHTIKPTWYSIAVAAAVRRPWRVASKRVIKKFPFETLTHIDQGDGEDYDVNVSIDRFSRSILRLRLEHPNRRSTPDVTVFGAHLKSKLPARQSRIPRAHRQTVGSAISTIRRTAEAAALRWILNNHMRSGVTPTVVLGDLNDEPRSNTLGILTENPNMSRDATGGSTALYSVLQLEQLRSFRDVYYTHEYRGRRDALDHILVSEEFFEGSDREIWALRDTRLWVDHIDDGKKNTSDHGIIRAEFR